MSSRPPVPIANGVRTDHPIPDLPFVDDSHLPIEDPVAIEAIGREKQSGMWGRHDDLPDGAWIAFTTEAARHDLGWVVRYHPEHGRTVTLYRNRDAADMHGVLRSTVMLFRAGSYWWDGERWFRPLQVFDWSTERYAHRPVPAAVSVSAEALLHDRSLAGMGTEPLAQQIGDVDPDARHDFGGSWKVHLAWWARQRPSGALPLDRCVVNVLAPELASDQLVGVPELAKAAGLASSTVRAYLSGSDRGDDLPTPQAFLGNRAAWSRPVVEEYAERRRRSPQGAAELLRTEPVGAGMHAVGIAELFDRLATTFHDRLWKNPDRRKRWALRWRSSEAVQQIANDLAWTVAGDLRAIVPIHELAATVRAGILEGLIWGHLEHHGLLYSHSSPRAGDPHYYAIDIGSARMLGWLIRHEPDTAARTINDVLAYARQRLTEPKPIPRAAINMSIRSALYHDGEYPDRAQLDTFLANTLGDELE